jgi:hypothetical protein
MIISEAAGKVLVDTVTPYNTPLVTWLKTNQKLLDITIIRLWATTDNYLIHAYKAIDLTRWVNIPDNDSIQFPAGGTAPPPTVMGILTYQHANVPFASYYDVLADGIANTGEATSSVVYGRFTASPGDYAYLIFPTLGLYDLHRIVGINDTVDFSTPGVAVNVPVNVPSIYTESSFIISGYPDTTHLAETVDLTYFSENQGTITDATSFFYPGANGFKKYNFSFYAADAGGDHAASLNMLYTDTVPANLSVPDPAWYTISLTTDTAVSVNFGTHPPTYYNVTSNVGSAQFTLTAPGDSTLLYPIRFYRALGSKYLGSLNINTMQMEDAYLYTDTQPDYQVYWVEHTTIFQAFTPGPAYPTFSTYQQHF